jgi:transcriptional regulator with XRE-family HTH domain
MSAPMNIKPDRFAWVDWIIAEREKMGMSQADLSRATGLTRATISDYESRQRPKPDIQALIKISEALGHDPLRLPRVAGIIPIDPETDDDVDDIVHEVRKMNKDDYPELLAYIRMKNNLRKKR